MAVQDWQVLEGGRPYVFVPVSPKSSNSHPKTIWDALRFLWEAVDRMRLISVHNRVMLKFWYNTNCV